MHITRVSKIKVNPLTDWAGVGWGGRGHDGGVKLLSNLLQAVKLLMCKVVFLYFCVLVFWYIFFVKIQFSGFLIVWCLQSPESLINQTTDNLMSSP